MADALFAELPGARRRELTSAVAHYIAGVLDRNSMIDVVDRLSQSADLKPGDAVRTLRGTLKGVIRAVLDDGRIVWRPHGSSTDLTTLPESLVPDD